MLFVSLVHARVWRCVKCTFLGILTMIIVSFGISFLTLCCSMCTLFPLRFHGFGAIHCETLATRWYSKSLGVLQPARRHVCFVTFQLGVFLSVVTCACHAVHLSVWQR